jgi:DNA-binding response OmpR family regulator
LGLAAQLNQRLSVTEQDRTEGTGPKVLVVDDDPALRQLLEDVLVTDSFVVVQAATGEGLADLVRQERPDIVVLDQVMEPVSGLDTLEHLRASGLDVPVLMLTATPAEQMLELAVDTGADDYITKPFSEAVLVAHIKALLRRQRWRSGETEKSP